MNNFTYFSPTRLVVGHEAEKQTGYWIRQNGGTSVLLVHDSGYLKDSGFIDTLIGYLEADGLRVVEFGGAVKNPRLSHIQKGIALCKSEQLDFVLAVGGGCVIDTSKGIAVGVPYDGDVWDFYDYKNGVPKAVPQTILPLGVVLTIGATGSEASYSSVINKEDENLKRSLNNDLVRPLFAIENPELTMSLPKFQTACGIIDIMAHSFERYFAPEQTDELSDRLLEGIMLTCMNCARVLMEDPNNYDARASVMVASTISHCNITGMGRSQDWASHYIEHELSGEYVDVTHSAGLACIIPAWMKYVYNKNDAARSAFSKWAVRVMGCDYDYDDPGRTIRQAIGRLEEFYHSLGMCTKISELGLCDGIDEDIMRKMARRLQFKDDSRLIGSIVRLNEDDVVNILKLAL